MKICICVSGQVRDNTEKSFLALQKLIKELEINNIEVVLIFSIWDEVFQKLDGAMSNFNQLRKIFASDIVTLIPPQWYDSHKLWKKLPNTYQFLLYNTKSNALSWTKSFFPKAIIDSEDGQLLDLMFDNDSDGFSKNSKKMLYKIWRVNEIKKKIERDSQSKFDFVIRVRPDFTIDKINTNIDKDAIYIPAAGEFGSFLHDTFAMGSSECMDYYCELFSKSISSDIKWGNIHVMLYNHLTNATIKCNVKSAEENGFILQTMSENKNKIDINNLEKDLNSKFYKTFFNVIRLKREKTKIAISSALLLMEDCYKLSTNQEERISFFILLHELYLYNNDFAGALKAYLLADMTESILDKKTLSWANRNSYVYNTIFQLCSKSSIDIVENPIDFLQSIKTTHMLDTVFSNSNLEQLKRNISILVESNQGQKLLKKEN